MVSLNSFTLTEIMQPDAVCFVDSAGQPGIDEHFVVATICAVGEEAIAGAHLAMQAIRLSHGFGGLLHFVDIRQQRDLRYETAKGVLRWFVSMQHGLVAKCTVVRKSAVEESSMDPQRLFNWIIKTNLSGLMQRPDFRRKVISLGVCVDGGGSGSDDLHSGLLRYLQHQLQADVRDSGRTPEFAISYCTAKSKCSQADSRTDEEASLVSLADLIAGVIYRGLRSERNGHAKDVLAKEILGMRRDLAPEFQRRFDIQLCRPAAPKFQKFITLDSFPVLAPRAARKAS